MTKCKDLMGKRFGRLTVTGYAYASALRMAYWDCVCDCGKPHTVRGSSLSAGVVRSCGCLSRELTAKRLTIHGGNDTASHRSWRHMRDRCLNPKNDKYRYYGGRGITICPQWTDYAVFRAGMGEPPVGYTLDRINHNGDYTPENCRWASKLTQSRNQRPRDNTSGHTGVYRTRSGKWVTQIRAEGARFCGPARSTIEEAVADRKELERLHWGNI